MPSKHLNKLYKLLSQLTYVCCVVVIVMSVSVAISYIIGLPNQPLPKAVAIGVGIAGFVKTVSLIIRGLP